MYFILSCVNISSWWSAMVYQKMVVIKLDVNIAELKDREAAVTKF